MCGPALCSACNSVPTQRTLPWTARPLYFPSSTENSFLCTLPMDTETQSHSCFVMRPLSPNNKLPLKLPGHGTRWQLNWFKRLADGSHLSPRTAERQYFCSSACPLPFNGECGLLPQHVHYQRLITHCSHFLLNFQLPTGFVLVG